jgi:hypothetical protein
VQQPPVGGHDRDTRLLLFAPSKVKPNKVHGPYFA